MGGKGLADLGQLSGQPPISPLRAGPPPGSAHSRRKGRSRKSPQASPSRRSAQRPPSSHVPEELLSEGAMQGPGPGQYAPGFASRPGTKAQNLFGLTKRGFQEEQPTLSPGPIYMLPSGIVKQADSTKRSAAGLSFGSGSRNETERMYLSKEHAKRTPSGAPGPGTYEGGDSVGKQPHSMRRTLPTMAFPAANRGASQQLYLGKDLVNLPQGMPAPGQYKASLSLGPQPTSGRETAGAFSFGSSEKCKPDIERNDFVPKEQQRVLFGNNSPGPVYLHESGTLAAALQREKKRSLLQKSTFGSAPRLAMSSAEKGMSEVPGPGSYAGASASSLGSQVRGRTGLSAGFGTSTRRHRGKLRDDTKVFDTPLGR